MDHQLVEAIEPVVIGSVAITARALTALGLDLTFLQWRVILVVGDRDEGATVSEIAARIGAHLSPTSRLISRLVARGLLHTAKDERDRRATRVTLTESGRAIRSQVLARRRQDLRSILDEALLAPGEEAVVQRLARAFGRLA